MAMLHLTQWAMATLQDTSAGTGPLQDAGVVAPGIPFPPITVGVDTDAVVPRRVAAHPAMEDAPPVTAV